MPALINQRIAAFPMAATIAVLCANTPSLAAQSATDARFDAIVTLAESKMKEFGVPGVALGVIRPFAGI